MSGSLPALGGPELVIILLVVVVLFGGARLAGIGKSFGAGLRESRASRDQQPGTEGGEEKDGGQAWPAADTRRPKRR